MKYIKKFENRGENYHNSNRNKYKEDFINRSIKLHNGKYDYSKVDYVTARKPVTIICPIHGEFKQMPYNHLVGKGCITCSGHLLKTKEKFAEKANGIHNNKYNYDESNYINDITKLKIICPEHGEFWQKPSHHLRGVGCPECAIKKNGNLKTLKSANSFPIQASKIHNKYDYSKVIYINSITPIEIICPKHGSFFQSPGSHLRGAGCPTCMESQGENKIKNYLIFNLINYERQKKFIGCRNKNLLSFDFWIESKNLLIEFDGEQHFNPVEFFGGENSFNYLKLCDDIKNKFCQDNKINLLRISYLDIKNVDKILSQYFIDHND